MTVKRDEKLPPDPWRRLMAAIILTAIRDAERGQVEACEWLAGGECYEMAVEVNVNYNEIRAKAAEIYLAKLEVMT